MKDLNIIIASIITEASNDDLNSIYEAIKIRRHTMSQSNRFTFKVGSNVKFSSRGIDYSGVIKTIKIKKATVKMTNGQTYLVPLNMLEAA